MGSGTLLKRAINKYGIENFKKEILFECSTEEEMNKKEEEIVDNEFVSRSDTYNIKNGGEGGFDYINKNNLQRFNKNHKPTKEYLKMLNKCGISKIKELRQDSEYCKKVSESISKGVKFYIEAHGFWWKGKKHNIETKKKISQINKIKQKGELNSQYGKCWIYNETLKQSKSIKKEELSFWINKEWKKGRKIKF
jgi:hypothetical protein